MDLATVVPPYVAKPLRLEPFRASMLAPARVGDPSSARALARPYRDVAGRLATWIERGWALRDTGPAIYLHEYSAGGVTIRGLVGALDVSARAADMRDRAVWPHEAVHPEQAADLAARMEEMHLNPAPILLVHDGDADVREVIQQTSATPPTWSFEDHGGQHQRLWAVRDEKALDQITRGLAETRCLIADGHHRYAAYLALQAKHPGTAWDAGLAMVVDQSDTPFFLGPIHRSLSDLDLDTITSVADKLGAVITAHPRADALNTLAPGTLVCTDGDRWRTITPEVRGADPLVEWLHDTLIPALPNTPRLAYHHTVTDVLASLGSHAVGALLPSADFTQIRDVVSSGRLLPEKATSFQPKPSLGVIMRHVPDA